jgi:hypothetical protein
MEGRVLLKRRLMEAPWIGAITIPSTGLRMTHRRGMDIMRQLQILMR